MSEIIEILVETDSPLIEVIGDFETPDIDIVFENIVERIVDLTYVWGEIPDGIIDGSNATFTTEFDFIPETLQVYINGLLQTVILHYNTSGTTTITFSDSPKTLDIIEVNYQKNI